MTEHDAASRPGTREVVEDAIDDSKRDGTWTELVNKREAAQQSKEQ